MIRQVAAPLAALVLVAACGADEPAESLGTDSNDQAEVTRTETDNGQKAYAAACAHCHDEGVDGAPKTGDPEAWASRSWLWEAVLFEHAQEGYLTMPARGGDESLDDATVARAAEYMLTVTFPDAPRD